MTRKFNKKRLFIAAIAVVALCCVAATYFGGVTVVSTVHGETNYFPIVLGNHQASVVRKISPSNAVDHLEQHKWNYSQLVTSSNGFESVASGTNVGQVNLWETNTASANYFRWQAPDTSSTDVIAVVPNSMPTAGQVLYAAAVSGSTATLGWTTAGSGSGTNFASITVTNTVQELWQTNILSGAGTTNLVIDAGQSAKVMCIVSNNFSVCFTNPVSGASGTVRVKQDGTGIRTGIVNYSTAHGGAFTNTYFGTEITGTTFSTNAGYSDYIRWICEGTNFSILGFVRGYNLP